MKQTKHVILCEMMAFLTCLGAILIEKEVFDGDAVWVDVTVSGIGGLTLLAFLYDFVKEDRYGLRSNCMELMGFQKNQPIDTQREQR